MIKPHLKKWLAISLLAASFSTLQGQSVPQDYIVMDMVHHNPGEPMTETSFREPAKLAAYGYNGMVINEFKFPQCALTFDKFDKRIFPKGSEEREWALSLQKEIRQQIRDCHKQGLKCYYFTDIIVLPKRLVELYKSEICDESGKISFRKEKTWEIHRLMLRELFNTFPEMDGLVIRTGETYTHNIPYHMGNGPVDYKKAYDESIQTHIRLMNLLREEVCVRRNKQIIYRTWDFGFFHIRPDYYMAVTEQVPVHPNLYIAIKHTNGDYFRTYPFNKTLTLGKHKQIVEVQCQREYEGKGAYPNYIAAGVIDGFEEYKGKPAPRCLNDIKTDSLFRGVWTWSRGGGWSGPFLKNELWCDLNAYVMSKWAQNPSRPEAEIFDEYADKIGITPETRPYFRRLSLLSADAIIRGRGSLIHKLAATWTRDEIIGGAPRQRSMFDDIYQKNLVEEALYEKKLATALWQEIEDLAQRVRCSDTATEHYIRTSAHYGYLLYAIMEQGWIINLRGYLYETKQYPVDQSVIRLAIEKYDALWKEFRKFKDRNTDCATLYFDHLGEYTYGYNAQTGANGMGDSVDHYRKVFGME